MIKQYVLGFCFDDTRENVVLIEKLKPDWQRGKLNGVGGKIEPGEAPALAMVREFEEETGVQTWAADWSYFAVMEGTDWQKDPSGDTGAQVHCYEVAHSDYFTRAKTVEEEKIVKRPVRGLSWQPVVPNVPMLIPAARQQEFQRPIHFSWAQKTDGARGQ